MLEKVIERLESFGYTLKDGDETILTFCVEKVENTVKNDCNVSEIPDGLMNIAIDMAVGEFLTAKKTFSPDDIAGLDLNNAVSHLKEGDTDITFGGSQSAEERLDSFINRLLTYGRDQFSVFRRLRW